MPHERIIEQAAIADRAEQSGSKAVNKNEQEYMTVFNRAEEVRQGSRYKEREEPDIAKKSYERVKQLHPPTLIDSLIARKRTLLSALGGYPTAVRPIDKSPI